MIFDTHAHYDDERYDEDLDETLSSIFSNGVGNIISCSTDYASIEKTLKLSEKYDNVYAAVGIYPHETHRHGQWDYDKMKNYCSHKKVVAVGEIGLDYYSDDAPKATQKLWVENQILLAKELDLPVLFHDREAHADSLELLKKLTPKGVVHCFSGSVEMARELTKIGMHIGFGGVVTFKNARVAVEVAADVPLEYMLLETDAPYLAPTPHRGERNRSDYIIHVAEKIAEIRGMTTEQIIKITDENARKLFKIS
ncbi:MAG: TatD family hydrolase [Clostridia bacterium]|nr:TatD family hydrolase [Clostridia bacterium]